MHRPHLSFVERDGAPEAAGIRGGGPNPRLLNKEGVLLQLPGLHFVAHPKGSCAAAGPGQLGVFLASVLRGDLATFER